MVSTVFMWMQACLLWEKYHIDVGTENRCRLSSLCIYWIRLTLVAYWDGVWRYPSPGSDGNDGSLQLQLTVLQLQLTVVVGKGWRGSACRWARGAAFRGDERCHDELDGLPSIETSQQDLQGTYHGCVSYLYRKCTIPYNIIPYHIISYHTCVTGAAFPENLSVTGGEMCFLI